MPNSRCFLIGHRDTSSDILPSLTTEIEHHIREQGISADHGKTGRSLVHSRFFHHIPYAVDTGSDLLAVDDTVFADFFLWDFHHTDDRHVLGLRHFDQLMDAGDTAKHDIIPQHDGKWFIGDEVPGAQDSVPQAALLLLPDGHDVDHFGYLMDLGQLVLLAAPLQDGFKAVRRARTAKGSNAS